MKHSHPVIFVLLFQGLCAAALSGRTALGGWEERFVRPPADARILKIIHNWPDLPEAQNQLIGRLAAQGLGGVVCNVSFDQYLESDARWRAFVRAVNEAKKAGLAMWLYDERGYPSGNAGGLVLRDHPEWEARGLLVADTESQGGPVTLGLPPGTLILAGAFPVHEGSIDTTRTVDLAAEVREGKLNWQAPPGRWRVMAITEDRLYEGTHAEGNLHAKIPYVNLLMPEPTARFIDVTYGGYAKHLGEDLGKYFSATFTDEPSLMSLFLRPMPYRPLPWAPNLPTEFQKRRGYTLDASLLPALVAEAGPAGAKIRYDYWLTVGELVAENYFGQIQTRCRQYRVPSGGHLLAEEGIAGHVPLYGDFFRCIRRLDAPSIDCLTSIPAEVPWYIARLLSSAAELEGRPLVMSETSDHSQHYRPAGDTRPRRVVTEAEIRGTCNRLIVAGVDCITSYYSFTGLSDEQLQRLNEWVGRCCTALRGGHQVADIAVLYPTESLWTRFVPSRHWTREAAAAARIENLYRTAAESLFTSQRDFTFIDSRAVGEAVVESSSLFHGPLRWGVVVLPGVDTLPLAVWENLAEFVRQGGAVIALGALPANSESEFPSARVQMLAQEIFGENGAGSSSAHEPRSHVNPMGGVGVMLPVGLESLLPQVLDGLLEPDAKVDDMKSPLRVTHRRLDGREVYFVINDSATPWTGRVDFSAAGAGEQWNPATGEKKEIRTARAVELSLEPYGAVLLRFASARPPQRHTLTEGAWPNLVLNTMPETQPIMGHGEFVRAELTADATHSRDGSPAWQADAVLTKSNVDTHLFLQFRTPQPLDLSDADCLALETWVPEGQTTPTQLLVILHEEGGGDFLAETSRSLAAPGRERTFVALSRFQLAGWSKDADGILDLKRVGDIRIGWGGYFGADRERIQFSVALPQFGAVTRARPSGPFDVSDRQIRISAGVLERMIDLGEGNVSTTRLRVDGHELLAGRAAEVSLTVTRAEPNSRPRGLLPGEGSSIDSVQTFQVGRHVDAGAYDDTTLGQTTRWVEPVQVQAGRWAEYFVLDAPGLSTPEPDTSRLAIRARARDGSPVEGLELAIVYEVYGGAPAIRKWVQIINRSKTWRKIEQLTIDDLALAPGVSERVPLTPAGYGAQPSLIGCTSSDGTFGVIAASEIPSALRVIHENGSMGYHPTMFEWVLAPGEEFISEPVFHYAFSGPVEQTLSARSVPLDRAVEGPFQRFVSRHIGIAGERLPCDAPQWLTWATFGPALDDAMIRQQADLAARAGFVQFLMDDGWQRDRLGAEPDMVKFPDFSATADYVRSRGLKLGLWLSCFRDAQSPDLKAWPDASSLPAVTRLGGKAMSFTTPWREFYAQDLARLHQRYGAVYFKQDFSNVIYGDLAEGHPNRTRKESLLRGLRGLLEAQDQLRALAPDVMNEMTHEIYWDTPGAPCDIAALKHAARYHVSPNACRGIVPRPRPGQARPAIDPQKVRAELVAACYQARQIFYSHRGLPLYCLEFYGAATEDHEGSLTPEVQDRQVVSWLLGAPLVFSGDLSTLSDRHLTHYRKRFSLVNRLHQSWDIYRHFQFSGVPAPTDDDWHWWGKLNDEGYGAVVVVRGAAGAERRAINVPWVRADGRYAVVALFAERSLGEFTGHQLQSAGVELTLPVSGQEILELTPAK